MGNTFSHHILTLVYREYNLYIAYFCRFEKKMCAFECIYIHVYAIYMYIVCQNFERLFELARYTFSLK